MELRINLDKLKEEEVALVEWLRERKLGRVESKLVLRGVADAMDMMISYKAGKEMDELNPSDSKNSEILRDFLKMIKRERTGKDKEA